MHAILFLLCSVIFAAAVWSSMVSWNALRAMHRDKDPLLERIGVRSPNSPMDLWRGIIVLAFTPAGDALPRRTRLAMRMVCVGSVISLVAGAVLAAQAGSGR